MYLPDCRSRRLTVTGEADCTPDSFKLTAIEIQTNGQTGLVAKRSDEEFENTRDCCIKVEEHFSSAGAPQYQPSSGSRRPSPTNNLNMVKPLSFKGDKKVKKRKRTRDEDADGDGPATKDMKTGTSQHADDQDDESWVSADSVSDISGPVIFVLPTTPPTCLACDANGKVFASPLENIVDDLPSTAEPDNVRQVFIASKIAGTDTFSFKGHHAKYVSLTLHQNSSLTLPLQVSQQRQVWYPLSYTRRNFTRRTVHLAAVRLSALQHTHHARQAPLDHTG